MARSGPVPSTTSDRRRPGLVDAAAWSYVAIAVVNLLVGAWLLSFVPRVVAESERAGKAVPTQAVTLATVSLAAATVLFSGALILFALRLRAGSRWARPALLTVSLLSLAALLVGGGPAAIVVVLCGVAAIVVTRASVTDWLRLLREPAES